MKIAAVFVSLVILSSIGKNGIQTARMMPAIPVIPRPTEVVATGASFRLSDHTVVTCLNDTGLIPLLEQFQSEILSYKGIQLQISGSQRSESSIFLRVIDITNLPRDGYLMSVNPQKISIEAPSPEGVYHGLQSLKQMIFADPIVNGEVRIPGMYIKDYPHFRWRGMHLDVVRHFFPVDSIKRYIDFLALYKFNVFHWHLTDDQGWRIAIDKYPKLTSVGSWRKPRDWQEDKSGRHAAESLYGGFYTKDEIREIVAYATERFVTVVPEIEMPGHSQAAIAAYPELGVTGKELEVKTRWGISSNILMPSENTVKFLENVLDEVLALFPSEYIHIGGDEAIKDQWKASSEVQSMIKNLGLRNEDELQSWFIGRIGKYLASKGRRLIGWDEILEGGLPPGAIVMCWRGKEGGLRAIASGHDVIMSPFARLYLNFSQAEDEVVTWRKKSITTLGMVYDYMPFGIEMSAVQRSHLLGAQGCVWTEHIPNFKQLEHMIFPRLAAVSEALWTDPDVKNFNDFTRRLKQHEFIFCLMNINYYKNWDNVSENG